MGPIGGLIAFFAARHAAQAPSMQHIDFGHNAQNAAAAAALRSSS